jgi:hypothetical protein
MTARLDSPASAAPRPIGRASHRARAPAEPPSVEDLGKALRLGRSSIVIRSFAALSGVGGTIGVAVGRPADAVYVLAILGLWVLVAAGLGLEVSLRPDPIGGWRFRLRLRR